MELEYQAHENKQLPMATTDFEFICGGKTLSGIIDQPANGKASAETQIEWLRKNIIDE